ncbi:uncharacterized protein BX664DRAFT_322256 [Halteromyces radiatus]|uniref:uncharacterized protein n=1 Tax=Halteromyces radiatus TaxID=101107 RepID=UPI00221E80A6|nr:uncharacterized protein BX664DRAFT_322256 [Halteromyces radiatus]KAI8099848.1 hypothetical protein BX664DRAFT_322256 [Halteromyces radiatus]
MTPSATERQKVLDILYNVLSNPHETIGNPLAYIILEAKEGYCGIELLKSSVTELNHYPSQYIKHCIENTKGTQPVEPRLELNNDRSKVRIKRTVDLSKVSNETDPLGFTLNASTSSATSPTLKTDNMERLASSSLSLSEGQFKPYKPSYNFQGFYDLEDEEDHSDNNSNDNDMFNTNDNQLTLLPVVYDNGKFYQDASFFNSQASESVKLIPMYEKIDIPAIGGSNKGSLVEIEKVCWNCELPGHSVQSCPEPYDREQVRKNREEYMMNSTGSTLTERRYYQYFEQLQQVSGLLPGRLSETLRAALGLRHANDHPPYYRHMGQVGYPPGYIGTRKDQERVMNLVTGKLMDEDTPDLKIFDDYDEKNDNNDNDNKELELTKQICDSQAEEVTERFQMVSYPGLYEYQAEQQQLNIYRQFYVESTRPMKRPRQEQQEELQNYFHHHLTNQSHYRQSRYRSYQPQEYDVHHRHQFYQQDQSYQQSQYRIQQEQQYYSQQYSQYITYGQQNEYYGQYDYYGQQSNIYQSDQSSLPNNIPITSSSPSTPPPPPPLNELDIDDDIPPPPPPA